MGSESESRYVLVFVIFTDAVVVWLSSPQMTTSPMAKITRKQMEHTQ